MSRPTRLNINFHALLHNVEKVQQFAPGKKIIAMVKADAYGCGIVNIAPVLEGKVHAFGVSCIEEALKISSLGCKTPCILFQGIFKHDELQILCEHSWSCVLHQADQVSWILNTPLKNPVKLWLKVNTGMNRLGFNSQEIPALLDRLKHCPWVHKEIGLMTHFACSDEPQRIENQQQLAQFEALDKTGFSQLSMANSGAIIAMPRAHYDMVRPGIMLYGVSPFANQTSLDLGLKPVLQFVSSITAIHKVPPGAKIGYSGTWQASQPSIIGIVTAGYGDGYPRHISPGTPVWVKGQEAQIVGRVSMDMMTIDLSDHPEAQVGDEVELWGAHVLVETIAQSAGTIGYELLCQLTDRARYQSYG